MSYVVTARKWRPMVFEDVIGQSHVTTTLRNAFSANRLSHAYIFSGPRGCGKTTTARILAKVINCSSPKHGNPDNTCELCSEITEGRSINVFEIDGASNRSIDDVRNLRDGVRYPPAKGKVKVYIIDEVHMLTKEAFNALLKTLEEPPPHVLFIFATTEIQKVPLTILSRCQRFDFRRNTIPDITGRLTFIADQEKIAIDADSLLLIAKKADGSMRDAQSLFDQIVAFCGTAITHEQIVQTLNLVEEEFYFRITDFVKSRESAGVLPFVDEIIARGYDLREFTSGLSEHLRNLLVVSSTGSAGLVEASETLKQRYESEAQHFSVADLLRLIKISTETETSLRWSVQPRYRLEVALLHMVKMDQSVHIDALLSQIEDLKKKLNGLPAETVRKKPSVTQDEPAEAPIRGSVKASHPSLRPDQSVSGFELVKGTTPFVAESMTAAIPVLTAEQTSGAAYVITDEEAHTRWSIVVNEAKKERIALGTLLGETRPISLIEDRLSVGCPDDFHLDQFRRNREYLNGLAARVYGARVRLEGVLAGAADHPVSTSSRRTDGPTRKKTAHDHPVVKALMREFGAREAD